MRPATIGDLRMFFQPRCWWLPDAVLVVAGCFRKVSVQRVAAASPRNGHRLDLTKRLSKHSLSKQTGDSPVVFALTESALKDALSGKSDDRFVGLLKP